jgi:KTSC domain
MTEASVTLFPYIPPEYMQTCYLKRTHVRLRGERIHSVFYDGETRMLEVRYSDGGLRWYADISERAYEALLSTDRPDEVLHREVFLQGHS